MRHNKLCLKSHREKILRVPLITPHMIFKGITKLEHIATIPYLLPFTSATTKLVKPLTYIASPYISRATLSPCRYLKQQLPIPCCSTQLFHVFPCLESSKIFNLGKIYSFMSFYVQTWQIFFLRHSAFFLAISQLLMIHYQCGR